jgi:Cu(I)/Ag(I) efflux system protein CusF
MKKVSLFAAAVIAATLVSAPAAAMDGADMPSGKTAAAKAVQGSGVVVSVNQETGSLILKHAPIPALEWPAMTMSFKVRDKAQLQPLKKGDKVEFTLEKSGASYVITDIK